MVYPGWLKNLLKLEDVMNLKLRETLDYRLKKAIDYTLDKLNRMIQNVGSQALEQLSANIRPKKNYKTNRKYLDGSGIPIPFPFVDFDKAWDVIFNLNLFKGPEVS